ncbi:spermatogenesis associated 6-like protein isoform X4 [Anolis carolinensis]|uniref:spermatogenesis associated 6-like protein isoform X4 n=1 Tax=Anolis carolinensis TaxID=28377 RepID=UPI002F2B472E
MPLKVVVELQVHSVSCPGVHLAEKSDVYLHVCIMGQCKETDCLPPTFPLLFHEKMWFEKIFEKATDPVEVVELLEKNLTKIRLSELISSEKEDLANYEENTRDFLFPEPKLTPPYPGVDRELLMNTPPSFPGIAPKLEFSTRTTITELPLLPRTWYRGRTKTRMQRTASASPRRKSVSPTRSRMAKSKSCKRFTRHLRSRSPSPSPVKHLNENFTKSQSQFSLLNPRSIKFKTEADHRPPFVVRHHYHLIAGNHQVQQLRMYSSPDFTWEEINERVRNLLTSDEARKRLSVNKCGSLEINLKIHCWQDHILSKIDGCLNCVEK